jgi:hypothetical protein
MPLRVAAIQGSALAARRILVCPPQPSRWPPKPVRRAWNSGPSGGRTRAALPVYAASGRLHPAPDRFTRSRHVVDPSLAVFREGKTQPLNLPAGALQRRGHFVLECAIRQQLLAEKINPRGALLLLLAPVFEKKTGHDVDDANALDSESLAPTDDATRVQPCRPEKADKAGN